MGGFTGTHPQERQDASLRKQLASQVLEGDKLERSGGGHQAQGDAGSASSQRSCVAAVGGAGRAKRLTGGQLARGLVGHLGTGGPLKYSEKPSQGFKTEGDMVQYALKKSLGLQCGKYFGRIKRNRD